MYLVVTSLRKGVRSDSWVLGVLKILNQTTICLFTHTKIIYLDRKMSKFKEGLDDYDQKEQYVQTQTEKLQNEQERALQEQRELQEVLQGLQAKHKVAEDELKALQKRKR